MKIFARESMNHAVPTVPNQRTISTQSIARAALGLAAVAVLSACASAPVLKADRPLYAPPAGTVVKLNTDLKVAKGLSRVFIQDGAVQASIRNIDIYIPYCALEVHRSRSALEKPFDIAKGTFTINRAWKDVDYASAPTVGVSWQVAANNSSGRAARWVPFPGERGQETMATFMNLNSANQPAVKQLICGVFADRLLYNHVTVNDIRATLGDVISLTVPGV